MIREACALALAITSLACDGSGSQSSRDANALPVQLVTLAATPVRDSNEYLASLTSRRTLELYAQVAAYVRAVQVRPGQPVQKGQLLIDLDTGQQTANLRSVQASLATKEANLQYAIKNDASSLGLMQAGVLSRLDYEQRHAQRLATAADVQAARAQVQAQANLLAFYRITAPSAGVVGDVPVKVGDYVTPQTELTSVEQNALVEVYVYLPVSEVSKIQPQTQIALLDQKGCTVCETPPTFISQQVDPSSQSVLVKTVCPNNGALRESEVLKARMIWSEQPGLTVPTSAVTRLAGQSFVFVATPGRHGLHAEQRPIQVGQIQGNDYVVRGGLKAGDRLVTSNIQKIRPGAPIVAAPEAAAGSAPPDRGAGSFDSFDTGDCASAADGGAPASPTSSPKPARGAR
jgi:RND family efflux transporter MFP subunit